MPATLTLRAILAGAIGGLAMAAVAQAVSIDVGSASGSAGSTVTVQVTLNAMGAQVGGITNVITFDSAAPIVGCTVSGVVGPISTVVLQPPGCTPGSDCQQVKAVITGPFSQSSLQPIPDGSVLYSCDVKIAASTAAETFPLTCSDPTAATPDSQDLPAQCSNGEVHIVNPTPTSTPAPGNGGGTCAVTAPAGQGRTWLLSLPAVLFLWWRGRHRFVGRA